MYSTFMSSKVIISPVSGSQITSADLISLLVPIPEAHVIRYTTDGTDPLPTSPIYTTPFTLPTGTRLVKAFVSVLGLKNSEISAASYIVSTPLPVVATPVFAPPSGNILNSTLISISCATVGSTITYSIDGGPPTTYTVPFTLAVGNRTVAAYATAPGHTNSATAIGSYTVSLPITATPVILPAAGAATTATQVSISCSTPTSAIHYTVDGSTPTVASPLYTVPFTMSVGTITVKAIGITTGYTDSAIATNVYTVSSPSLVDATKWVGSYSFNDGVGSNIVTTGANLAPAANVKLTTAAGVLAGIAATGGYANTQCVNATGSGANELQRGFVKAATVSPTEWSFAFFAKTFAGAPGADVSRTTDLATLLLLWSGAGNAVYNNAGTQFTFPQIVEVADNALHHYCFTRLNTENTWKVYRDGVLVSTVAATGTFSFRSLGFTTGIFGAREGYADNFCVILERISLAAIQSLAAGNLPDASGNLV